jgi:excisionase family DNA binding protein
MKPSELFELLARALTVEELTLTDIPPLIARLVALQNALMVHWSTLQSANHHTGTPRHDELLTIDQAADRLNLSVDYLYRNAAKLPFTIRIGRLVRFSANDIDDYIRRKQAQEVVSEPWIRQVSSIVGYYWTRRSLKNKISTRYWNGCLR